MPLNFDRNLFLEQLVKHEDRRLKPYDDATGQAPILGKYVSIPTGTGSTSVFTETHGNITIGIGHNLTNGISLHIAEELFTEDVNAVVAEIEAQLPWVGDLSDARQRGVLDLAFNLGVHGLIRDMPDVLNYLKTACWNCAGNALQFAHAHYVSQVHGRAIDIADLFRKG
jgi:lysozyme